MSRYANRILFFIVFVLPLIVIAYYEVAIATDRYQSEASLIISQEKAGTTTFDVSFLGLPSSADDKDARVVEEFIMSRDMLHFLDDKHHLREHYSASRVDWLGGGGGGGRLGGCDAIIDGSLVLSRHREPH